MIGSLRFLISHSFKHRLAPAIALALGVFALSGCTGVLDSVERKANIPVPKKLIHKMKAKGMPSRAPIMLRIFKEENTLEVWKKRDTGRYGMLTSYDICKWSGKLGPKFKEGDKQAPEGFYTVNKWQMNPNSKYHLAFNMGFPNRYDRAHGRTGSHLMIHGACSSAGCYSMTDEYVEEIYALAREAFKGGQKAFQIQAYPFRMTAENMAKHKDHKHFEFWKMLKRGYDHFEITSVPPKVDVCEKRYVFNTTSSGKYESTGQCPAMEMPQTLAAAFVARQKKDAAQFEKLLGKGTSAKMSVGSMDMASLLPGVAVKTPNKTPVAPKPAAPKPAPQPTPSASTGLETTLKPAG